MKGVLYMRIVALIAANRRLSGEEIAEQLGESVEDVFGVLVGLEAAGAARVYVNGYHQCSWELA